MRSLRSRECIDVSKSGHSAGFEDEAVPLLKWPKGLVGRVLRLEGDDAFKQRLREMGLCESAEVSVLQINGCVLCQVKDSRFGLSRSAAEAVIIGGAI